MASIFALKRNEQRDFVKVPRSARSKFCDLQNAHYVKCYIIEQYSVTEDIELCTLFCNDELEAEDFSNDESADDTNLPVTATLQGNSILTSHLRSVVDGNKLLLDIQTLYGTYIFLDEVQFVESDFRPGTPEDLPLPCNQLSLLRKARELQSMLCCRARLMLDTLCVTLTFKVEIFV